MKEQEIKISCCCCGLPETKPEDKVSHTICPNCLEIEYPEEYKKMRLDGQPVTGIRSKGVER